MCLLATTFLWTFLQWSWPLCDKGHELYLQLHICSLVWKKPRQVFFCLVAFADSSAGRVCAPWGWHLQQEILIAEEQPTFQGNALHCWAMWEWLVSISAVCDVFGNKTPGCCQSQKLVTLKGLHFRASHWAASLLFTKTIGRTRAWSHLYQHCCF